MNELQTDILYIGISATSTLKRRISQEIKGIKHGTFFRSIGAVLGYRPMKGSLLGHKNKNNYYFDEENKRRIIEWCNINLLVSFKEYKNLSKEQMEQIENNLFVTMKPVINIDRNPYRHQEVCNLRRICKDIANEYLSTHINC